MLLCFFFGGGGLGVWKPYKISAAVQPTFDTWETLKLPISILPTAHLLHPLILQKSNNIRNKKKEKK